MKMLSPLTSVAITSFQQLLRKDRCLIGTSINYDGMLKDPNLVQGFYQAGKISFMIATRCCIIFCHSTSLLPPDLTFSLPFLLQYFPGCCDVDTDLLFIAKHATLLVLSTQTRYESPLTFTHCQNEHLCPKKATLLYVFNKYSECSLTCLLNRTTEVGSILGSVTSKDIGFLLLYGTGKISFPLEQVSKSIKKTVGYSPNWHVTTSGL